MRLVCPYRVYVFKFAPLLLPALLSLFLCFATFHIASAASIVLLPTLLFFSFTRPVTGIYALIITASSLDAVPDKLNLQLIVFLLVCSAVFVRFLLDINAFLIRTLCAHRETRILFCFAFLLVVNFFVAQLNGISASLWLRGVVPFLFLFLTFACLHYYKSQEHLHYTLTSVVIYSSILTLRQLSVAVQERVWAPIRHIYDAGAWVQSMDGTGELFWERITMLFPQSTDPAFLVGFFILVIWVIYSFRSRLLALVPIYGLLFCMILTYSRSFMISLLAGFVIITGYLFRRGQKLAAGKFFIGLMLTMICILLTVELFALAPFENRYLTLYNTLYRASSEIPASDPNIMSRAEEIQIAWALFKEEPILGKGFGVQHVIDYDTGYGVTKSFTKGYIHNWFFYFLMATGIFGTVIYSSLYVIPLFRIFKRNPVSRVTAVELILVTSLPLLNLYSLLFASFRLIPYNIMLACLISMPLALSAERSKIMASKSANSTGVKAPNA